MTAMAPPTFHCQERPDGVHDSGRPALTPLSMEVVNGEERAEAVEFQIHETTVVAWHPAGTLTAEFDRQTLRAWLLTPGLPLIGGQMIFIQDRSRRVTLVLPGLDPWPLAPTFLEQLRQRV